jgi:hypothetical protein
LDSWLNVIDQWDIFTGLGEAAWQDFNLVALSGILL